jgi:hypothetical protein
MKYTNLLLLILISGIALGQDLKNNVPTLASPVFIINTASINEKCNQADIDSYEFFKDFKNKASNYLNGSKVQETLVPMLVGNAKEFGLSVTDNSYAYVRNRDSINYTAFISKVADAEALNGLIKSLILNQDEIKHGIGEGFEFAYNDRMILAWNGSMVAFVDYHISYYSMFETVEEIAEELDEEYYESYNERYEAEEKKSDDRKRVTILVALEEIFNPNPDHTMSGNDHFTAATAAPFDVAIFVDGTNGLSSEINPMTSLFGRNSDFDNFLSEFSDTYSYFHVSIKENDAEAKAYYHLNEKYRTMVLEANKAKFNKDLLKYVDGENLIGYFGMRVKPEPIYKMTMEMYAKMFEAVPDYGESIAAGLGIFEILLDEDEIFDLIKGDMFVAITDLKEFDVSYTSYDYDEDFNEQEVIKTKQELLPEFVFLASVGNKKLRDKIVKLYLASKLFVEEDGYFKYKPYRYGNRSSENQEGGTYFAFANDILIVTNNKDLVTKYKQSGIPKENQLSKDRINHIKKNNYAGYWNVNATFLKMDKQLRKSLGRDISKMMTYTDSLFNEASLTGMKLEGDCFTTTANLSFKNDEKPVVNQVLEFVEKLYHVDNK